MFARSRTRGEEYAAIDPMRVTQLTEKVRAQRHALILDLDRSPGCVPQSLTKSKWLDLSSGVCSPNKKMQGCVEAGA